MCPNVLNSLSVERGVTRQIRNYIYTHPIDQYMHVLFRGRTLRYNRFQHFPRALHLSARLLLCPTRNYSTGLATLKDQRDAFELAGLHLKECLPVLLDIDAEVSR